jgi:hypothetical protein
MQELAQWLRSDLMGLATYRALQLKLLDAAKQHRDRYVVYYMIATLIERFVFEKNDTPLTSRTTDEARKRLIAMSDKIARFDAMSCDERLQFLNEIAAAELS